MFEQPKQQGGTVSRITLKLKQHFSTKYALLGGLLALPLFTTVAQAAEKEAESTGHGHFGMTFLWLAIILILAKLSGLIEKWGQPSVLGELVLGIILGNLVLLGVDWFEPIKHNAAFDLFQALGVVVLLFMVGLESNIHEMRKVGLNALGVALIGIAVPFVLGTWVVGPWLMPGLDSNAYLFLGAALTATSVGITARIFKDLGQLKTQAAQIIVGAAVIDDVGGLIILAVVSAIAATGAVSAGIISWIAVKAFLFLAGAIIIGMLLAPGLGRFFSKIQTGNGMKFTLAITFGLALAGAAELAGLEPIVGAFAAGLVLDPVHFKYFRKPHVVEELEQQAENGSAEEKAKIAELCERHTHKHIEDLVEPVMHLFVPVFFVLTGMSVKLETLSNPKVIGVALAITAVAFVGKLAAGLMSKKGTRWLVGWGMVPRGEVGLIFAATGQALGVVSDEVFSVIVIMVILTTLLTPPILSVMLKKKTTREATA